MAGTSAVRAAGLVCGFILLFAVRLVAKSSAEDQPPKVGDVIDDYAFRTLAGEELKLADAAAKGPVVVAVLRGYPGYQCPACTKQVADLRKHAEELQKLKATVVLVYPGQAEQLTDRAKEFLKDTKLPAPLVLVTDPDFEFITQHKLRWDAPGETAYPSTFVLDGNRKVQYARISKTHGDRAKTDDVLGALRAIQAAGAKGREIPNTR